MKKLLISILLCLLLPVFTGCEISNTDLANSLEGNMTRLVYSIGYLDSISTEDLSDLVNNSSYFTHSSLYNGETIVENEGTAIVNETATTETPTNTLSPTTTDATTALNGGLTTSTLNTVSGRSAFSSDGFRSNTYSSGLTNQVNSVSTVGGYSAGVVDLSLLESNASDLNEILLEISKKRGIIMLYCTDLRSGRATLSTQDKQAIAEYDDIIEETANYLNNNTGALTNYFNGISSISGQENSAELINAKLIRANEVLKTRYAKLDTCLDSLNAILNIMVNSIGYDYSNLYNATVQENSIALTDNENVNSINDTTITNNENINPLDITTNETTTSNTTTYPITNPLNNSTNNNCCPDINTSNSCNSCYQTTNNTTNSCCPNTTNTNNSCCPNTTTLNNSSNTINSNNCCPSTTTEVNTPATLELTDKDYEHTQNPILNTDTNTQTEIALSGGLVKNNNKENIPAENIDNVVVKTTSSTPSNLTDETPAKELRFASPVKPNEETIVPLPISPTPPIKDFSDPEFSESEKELTPELLPFTSTTETTEPNTLELKPLTSPELGNITFLPFKYQEDDVLKKIPRT